MDAGEDLERRSAIPPSDDSQLPTREQLKIQISILNDDILRLQTELNNSSNDSLYKKYNEIKIKEYEFQGEIMNLNIDLLRNQKVQTYTIMILVVIVVLAGIVFSGFQLWYSVSSPDATLDTNLQLSLTQVRITTSIVGLAVLVISIAFLYIYTHEVYHIKMIDPFKPKVDQPD